MKQYHIDIIIRSPDGKQHRGAIAINASEYPALAPYDRCSSGLEALAFGGVTSTMGHGIDRSRKQIVTEIVGELTSFVMDKLKSADTENGYTQEENQAFKEGRL
jgi:hypothetical protein